MSNYPQGLDISVVQGTVDYVALKNSGIQFCIFRCGVGNSGIDRMYAQNVANAQAAGLLVGCYHFVYPLPTIPSQPLRDPTAQAQYHANAAGSVPVVCCDLEWPATTDWAKWGCSAPQIVQWTIDYLAAYEQITGIRPLVYTYPNFAQSINLPASFGQEYKLWIASYASTPFIPAPWTDWVMWQNSGGTTTHLPNGCPVDTDVVKDLSLWSVPAAARAAAVAPPPVVAAPSAPVPAAPPAPPITATPASAPAKTNLLALIWKLVSALVTKYLKR
jgi:lysozyme